MSELTTAATQETPMDQPKQPLFLVIPFRNAEGAWGFKTARVTGFHKKRFEYVEMGSYDRPTASAASFAIAEMLRITGQIEAGTLPDGTKCSSVDWCTLPAGHDGDHSAGKAEQDSTQTLSDVLVEALKGAAE